MLLGLLLAMIGCGKNNGDKAPETSRARKDQSLSKKEKENESLGPVVFEDITDKTGIAFTYRNGEEANHLSILESLGGGVGLIDFDRDGRVDIFLTGGGYYTGKDRKDIIGHPCKLYRNLDGARFQDVTAEVNLHQRGEGKSWFYSHGVAVADYDRDGWPDLLVTGWQAVALFRNVPADPTNPGMGRHFEDVTAKAGLDKGIDWVPSAAFGDLDGDGYPDLYLCQYLNWSWQNHPRCSYDGKISDVCPPKQFAGLPDKLFRNTGRGAFVDVSKEVKLETGGINASKALGVLMVDVDGDGKPDIYVANDTVDNLLYLNKSTDGRLNLQEDGLSSGVARDDRGTANGSMGLDAGDPERTGKPALWVTNYENELHALYRNDCRPGQAFFHYSSLSLGIAAIGQKYVGWGTAFLDFDRDGWEDLFIAHGHAFRYPGGKEEGRKLLPVLLRNHEGKFLIASRRLGTYFQTPRQGRGAAFGDLDNDGRTDLVISHLNEPVAILRGIGGDKHHWLGLELIGKDNACAVGARVVFEGEGLQQTRFVKGGGSYASANEPRLLFGLGEAKSGQVIVTWPDGKKEHFKDLAVDRYHRLVQGQTKQGK